MNMHAVCPCHHNFQEQRLGANKEHSIGAININTKVTHSPMKSKPWYLAFTWISYKPSPTPLFLRRRPSPFSTLGLERPHIVTDILHVSISLIKIKNTAPSLLINSLINLSFTLLLFANDKLRLSPLHFRIKTSPKSLKFDAICLLNPIINFNFLSQVRRI